MTFRPVGSYLRVLVRRDPDDSDKAGVIVPLVSRRHSQFGTVVRIMNLGVGTAQGVTQHSDVKPGERVYFGKYSGTDVLVDGEMLTIMPESEILAVVDP